MLHIPKAAYRLPLLVPGFIALGMGVLAGLSRLGWSVGSLAADLTHAHGPLMVAGFFGTVIGLERAVALRHPLAYLAPALTGFGSLAFIAGLPDIYVGNALLAGSVVFLMASLMVLHIQLAAHTILLAIGALALVAGNLIWLSGAPFEAVLPGWIAFLVLTIVGERLELSRMRPVGRKAKAALLIILTLFGAGSLLETLAQPAGAILFGPVLAALAGWLILYDIARVTIRQTGLVRYIAVCLLSGYGWLAAAGLIWTFGSGLMPGAYVQDAALHALFLGFVFAMVFGHAPIIFPAVTTFPVPYHRAFYLHLIALEISLALRVVGDLAALDGLRAAASMGNAASLALFIANTAIAVRRGLRVKTRPIG